MENKKMKAIVAKKYGPPEVLQLKEVDKPTPKNNEVLIKIFATTVHVGDVRMRKFDVPRSQWLFAKIFLGIRGPRNKILGMEEEKFSTMKKIKQFKKVSQLFTDDEVTILTKKSGERRDPTYFFSFLRT